MQQGVSGVPLDIDAFALRTLKKGLGVLEPCVSCDDTAPVVAVGDSNLGLWGPKREWFTRFVLGTLGLRCHTDPAQPTTLRCIIYLLILFVDTVILLQDHSGVGTSLSIT